eukprot:501842-Amphidinium_carterae.1
MATIPTRTTQLIPLSCFMYLLWYVAFIVLQEQLLLRDDLEMYKSDNVLFHHKERKTRKMAAKHILGLDVCVEAPLQHLFCGDLFDCGFLTQAEQD